ncbi:MAG: hypothetical protein FWH27_01730 [Planctomycetaceae bacterium]|nr:hypothetical protein [Planctomycetaceae bacterium]
MLSCTGGAKVGVGSGVVAGFGDTDGANVGTDSGGATSVEGMGGANVGAEIVSDPKTGATVGNKDGDVVCCTSTIGDCLRNRKGG